MASTLKHLLQRFTFWAAGGALVTVLVLASLAGAGVRRTFERLANERGAEVAARATALVTNYVRDRLLPPDRHGAVRGCPAPGRRGAPGGRAGGRLHAGPRRVAAHRDRVGRQRLPAARGPAREPGIRPGRRGVAPGSARHGVVRSGAPARDDPEHGPRPRARCVGAGGTRALPRERGLLLGAVPRAAGRRVRHRSGGARLSVARGHRPVGVRRAVDAVARALAQRARGGPRAHSERCRGPRGERRPERVECG